MTTHIIVDLGYGDCGKGTAVDFLARQDSRTPFVVRYNGGPQAAHNVVTPDGRHHTFAQFGSATLAGGKTYLSRYMLINPLTMTTEADHLITLGMTADEVWGSLYVDKNCLVITPWHMYLNKIREISRGASAHGSCGHGVGEAKTQHKYNSSYSIRVRDLIHHSKVPKVTRVLNLQQSLRNLRSLLNRKAISIMQDSNPEYTSLYEKYTPIFSDDTYLKNIVDAYIKWADQITATDGSILTRSHEDHHLIFEGAQGVLLDQEYGFFPHVTYSDTTELLAKKLIYSNLIKADNFNQDEIETIGVIRPYTTRHGHGPLLSESFDLTTKIPDVHNTTGRFQGAFRVGYLDLLAHKYAVSVTKNNTLNQLRPYYRKPRMHSGIDSVFVTNLDRLNEYSYIDRYEYTNPELEYSLSDYFTKGPGKSVLAFNQNNVVYSHARRNKLMDSLRAVVSDPVSVEGILKRINAYIGDVKYTSWGPTAKDKEVVT